MKFLIKSLFSLSIMFILYSCSKQENFSGHRSKFKEKEIDVVENLQQAEVSQVYKRGHDFVSAGSEAAKEKKELEQQINKNKIIYHITIEFDVKDIEKVFSDINEKIKNYQGYLIFSQKNIFDYEVKIYMQMKIPSNKYENFLKEIRSIGKIRREFLNSQDISKEYFDLQTKLKSKETVKIRLEKLLANRTAKLSEVLEVERELERILTEIDLLKGSLRFYDNRIEYATFDVFLNERIKSMPSDELESILAPFKNFIRNILFSFGVFVSLLAWLIPWILVATGIYFLIRLILKKLKK